MKKVFIALALGVCALSANQASAWRNAPASMLTDTRATGTSFYVDGRYYTVISEEESTVSFGINWQEDQTPYIGDVVVPATVSYGGKTYTVTEIGKFAFDDDAAYLRSVTLPNTIRKICSWAFYGTHAKSVNLPEGLVELETNSFCEGALEETLVIPSTLSVIGDDVFMDCKNIETLIVSEGVTQLGKHMFDGCSAIESVTLPSTLQTIYEYAFFECAAIPSIEIPDGVTRIDKYAFAKCMGLTSLTVPESVTTVGKGIICDCNYITSVTLPQSWTELPEEMFSYCVGLTSYVMSDNIVTVGPRAFEYALSLNSVTIGSSVQSFGVDAFKMCNALTEVTCRASVPPTGVTFPAGVYSSAILTVPSESVAAYKAAEGWSGFTNVVGANMSSIGEVGADSTAPQYFNLQGVRVLNPSDGIYLVRRGDKVAKEMVR